MASGQLEAGAVAAGSQPTFASTVRSDARTGRLVRRVIASGPAGEAQPGAAYGLKAAIDELIDALAESYELDPLLVRSVIKVESDYDPYAVSPKGAKGLMQLIPTTARRFGASNSFDIRQNVEAGIRYLKYLTTLFDGDQRLAIAAYNAGEGAVTRYNDVPPFAETRAYVERVGKKYTQARRQAPPEQESAAARIEAAGREHAPVEMYRDAQGRICLRTN
jgi:soluble lytic murein transglycosylase-like protein